MKRTAEQTRELLIGCAIDMLHEQGASAPVSHIRLGDVVKCAGLTTGAAYRLWNNQAEFHRDLAVAAIAWRSTSPAGPTVDSLRDLVHDGAPVSAILRAGAEVNLHVDPVSHAFLVTIALRASAHRDHLLLDASLQRHTEAIESFAELYDAMMNHFGRRMRAPFTLRHFTLTLAALSEGFVLQSMTGEVHPRLDDVTESGSMEEWTLLAASAMAIVEYMTDRIPPEESGATPTDS